ncbi:MAG TPA: ABC transporter permease, partial [Dongiaceae bacterium]
MKSLLRVLGSVVTTLLGLLLVTFVISRFLPADPVLAVVGDHASDSTIQAARIRLGLDQPIVVQFWLYLKHVLLGDLGTSIRTG